MRKEIKFQILQNENKLYIEEITELRNNYFDLLHQNKILKEKITYFENKFSVFENARSKSEE